MAINLTFKILAVMDFEILPGVTCKDDVHACLVEAENEDQAKDFVSQYLEKEGFKNVRILQCELELNPDLNKLF